MRKLLHPDSPWPPNARDSILTELLSLRSESNQTITTILSVVCLPITEAVFSKKRGYDFDTEELWHNLQEAFLKIIHRLDVSRRPKCISQKIYNDLVHDLHSLYLPEWKWRKEMLVVDGMAKRLASKVCCGSMESKLEAASEIRAKISFLESLKEDGSINEFEFLLLVATEVYRREIKEFANEQGRSYEAVKRRRQRLLKKIPDFRKTMSPEFEKPPL